MSVQDISSLFDKEAHCIESSSVSNAGSNKSTTKVKVKLQHPLELFLVEDAVQYLKADTAKTVVLLDIIVRDDEGKISLDSNNKPETHTVVLCKTPQVNEYLIIDPNKVSHSNHMVGPSVFDKDFSITAPKISDIYTGQRGKIGPKADQFRDCIDIAVKLALGFEVMQGNHVDPKSLGTHQVVQMVSNNSDLDKAILKVIGEKSVRIKQQSDTESIKKFHYLEIILDDDIKRLDAIDHGRALFRKKQYEDEFAKTFAPENYGTMVQYLIRLDHDIRQDTITCLGESFEKQVLILGDSTVE